MISNFLSRRRSNESDSSANRRIPSDEESSAVKESAPSRIHSRLSKSSEDKEPSTPANQLQLAQKVLQDARSQRNAAKCSQRSNLLSGEEQYRKARNLAAFESLPKLYKSTLDSKNSKSKGNKNRKEARRSSVEETDRKTLLKKLQCQRSTCIDDKNDHAKQSLLPKQKSLSSRQLTSQNKDKDDKKVNKIMNELKIHHRVLETYYKSKKENENQEEENKDRSINKLIETFLDSYEEVMSMTTRQKADTSSRRGSDSTESTSSISCNSITGRRRSLNHLNQPSVIEFDRAQASSSSRRSSAPPEVHRRKSEKKKVRFGLPSTLKKESPEAKKRGSTTGGEIKGILRKNSFIYKSTSNKNALK